MARCFKSSIFFQLPKWIFFLPRQAFGSSVRAAQGVLESRAHLWWASDAHEALCLHRLPEARPVAASCSPRHLPARAPGGLHVTECQLCVIGYIYSARPDFHTLLPQGNSAGNSLREKEMLPGTPRLRNSNQNLFP